MAWAAAFFAFFSESDLLCRFRNSSGDHGMTYREAQITFQISPDVLAVTRVIAVALTV